jgi:lipid II:glycine glycyltransferase (peptidoglycan interpeptide bridge formation enzyme)
MDFKIEKLSEPDKDWDNRTIEGDGDIYQTTTYAEFQEKCLGLKSTYLIVKNRGKIVGQIILTSGPRFAKYLNKRSQKLKRFFEKHFMVYTSIRGPIILDKKNKIKIYGLILDEIEKIAKKGYAIKDFSLPINEDKKIYGLFYGRDFYADEWGTIVVDTTKTEDDLWKNIKKSRRNIVRKGEKQGLSIKRVENKGDYKKAYLILKEMSKRNKIFCHSWKYYKTFFSIFGKQENGGIFLVKQKNKYLATITLYEFNRKTAQTAVGYSNTCLSEKISATDFIEWFLIKYCQNKELRFYDLAGIRPDSKDKKNINLKEYKSRWGGEEIHYPYFSKEYSWWKKQFVNLLIKTVKTKYQKNN